MFQQENESEDGLAELQHEMLISEFYTSVTYGFQLENKYKHEKTNADIMAGTCTRFIDLPIFLVGVYRHIHSHAPYFILYNTHLHITQTPLFLS